MKSPPPSVITQTIRKRRSLLALDKVPSMAEFLHQRTVLHQYRNLLRASSKLVGGGGGCSSSSSSSNNDKDRSLVALEIKNRFRQAQFETDALSIQMAIRDGERQLMQLQSMTAAAAAANDDDDDVDETSRNTNNSNKNKTTTKASSCSDPDSWINTKDPEDPRGRVGEIWPWQSASKTTDTTTTTTTTSTSSTR